MRSSSDGNLRKQITIRSELITFHYRFLWQRRKSASIECQTEMLFHFLALSPAIGTFHFNDNCNFAFSDCKRFLFLRQVSRLSRMDLDKAFSENRNQLDATHHANGFNPLGNLSLCHLLWIQI